MKFGSILLMLLMLGLHAERGYSADDYFQDYGQELDLADMRDVEHWAIDLPAVANVGQGYLLCAVRPHSGPERFSRDFEACWSGYDPTRSCSYRCGGATHIFGFYTASDTQPGSIEYAIVCRCDNVVHNFRRYPVPDVVP